MTDSGADLDLVTPNVVTTLDPERRILWARMTHRKRACCTPGLLRDMRALQLVLKERFAGRSEAEMPFRWLVWASKAPKAWNLGGDLASFTAMIREADAEGLRAYAHQAIDILHDNDQCLGLPITTVALLEGDAIGGGFEAMLTHGVVIAEDGVKFGMPEILFNLFPGMGGYSFLERRVGMAMARKLVEDGMTRTAAEVRALGLVDVVCEPGQGVAALHAYVAENAPRFTKQRLLRKARQRVSPVTRAELIDIVDIWVELALTLTPDDLRRMDCLARVQERKRAADGAISAAA